MIFDKENLFSDKQAIVASAASTNVIDLGLAGSPSGRRVLVRDIGQGAAVPLQVQVVEGFNNLTSLTVVVEGSDDVGFTTPVVLASESVVVGKLVEGAAFEALRFIPKGSKQRYLRLFYTVEGSAPTLGKVTAGVVGSHQEHAL